MNNKIVFIGELEHLSLHDTLDCGQAFRWKENSDGSFSGVAFNKNVRIFKDGHNIYVDGIEECDKAVWRDYFDLDRDYEALKEIFKQNPFMEKAISFAPGIRVLKQEGFETIISFIISQNNNIKRIKGIIENLCIQFGEKVGDSYSFPIAEKLASLTADDLAPLKAGFRNRYIIDAATKIHSGEVNLNMLYTAPIEEARNELMKIVGIGRKVADCSLLFGFNRVECYPVDVWIKRVDAHFFPDGLPEYLVPEAGIAQQYLFHYARVCPEAFSFLDKE